MLQVAATNELAARLNELGLFPEPLRAYFAERVMSYCLSGRDPAVLWSKKLKSVMTAAEWEALLSRVRSELLSDLDRAIDTCTRGWDRADICPESVIDPLAALARHLPDLFPGDRYVARRVEELDALIDEWISKQKLIDNPERHDRGLSAKAKIDRAWTDGPTRSVFDDLLDGRRDGP